MPDFITINDPDFFTPLFSPEIPVYTMDAFLPGTADQ
jgi:hypothetical protein